MTILALCPVHGSFESRALGALGNIQGLHLSGSDEPCPSCRRPSRIMEGSFNVRDGLIELLAAPEWTRALLLEATDAVRVARDKIGTGGPPDLTSEITALTEQLSSLNVQVAALVAEATKGKSKKHVLTVLGAILTLLMWLYTAEDVGNFSEDTIAPVVDHILAEDN